MSLLPVANSQPSTLDHATPGTKAEKPARPKRKGKNYAQIHSKPLPLEIYPLPAFHPTNPISLLRLAYTWISHIIFPPLSHPPVRYVGYFSPETRSVHITHPVHVRALWEMGFFGKGTLSRSEPNWLKREKARLRREKYGAEDATNARREERRLFKLERARVEAEKIERQRLIEEGKLGADGGVEVQVGSPADESDDPDAGLNGHLDGDVRVNPKPVIEEPGSTAPTTGLQDEGLQTQLPSSNDDKSQLAQPRQQQAMESDEDDLEISLQNQEHLTLTMEEAFFLTYSLGVLTIYPPQASADSPPLSPKSSPRPYTTRQLLHLFIQHTPFPPGPATTDIIADDAFLLNYIAYHHFRSLGWVIRSGIKFGVDYLLYNRGPAFSHAEFAVIVVPAYTHRFWNTPGGRLRRRISNDGDGDRGGKDWWWLHAVNRVQSQVKKTLVLAYVDVPSPLDFALDLDVEREEDEAVVDIGRLLRMYRVREFVVRRWVPNRSRD